MRREHRSWPVRPLTPSARSGKRHRGGAVLVVAMVVLGCALFVGVSVISWLHAGSAVSATSRDVSASRALARSGVGAIASELNRQRRGILRGESPYLESQYTIFEAGDRAGVIRLLPIGLRGERLVGEAGKLDINMIDDAATLVATGLVLPALADEIIRHRDEELGRPYQSELELLDVRGMTLEILYGSVERLVAPGAVESSPGLVDVLTIYGVEPALQENGRLRINLNVDWSEELRERVADRFGEEIASGLQQVFDQGIRFDSEQRLFELLRFFQVPPEDWHDSTDSFTTEKGQYHRGRLDLNTASYEALRGLPGIEFEQAAELASAQDSLTSEERKSVAWPAMLGILKPEQMDALGGLITTRSWTWRVRFEAGVVDIENPDGPLEGVVRYEAVIDLASPRPRIAYLRDITLLSDAVLIASSAEDGGAHDQGQEHALDDIEVGEEGGDDSQPGVEPDTEDDGDLDFGMDAGPGRSLDFGGDDEDEASDERAIDQSAADDDREEESGASDPPSAPARIGRWAPGK